MLHIINCITHLLNYVAIYWSSQLQTGLGYSSSQSVPSRSLAHLLASKRSIPWAYTAIQRQSTQSTGGNLCTDFITIIILILPSILGNNNNNKFITIWKYYQYWGCRQTLNVIFSFSTVGKFVITGLLGGNGWKLACTVSHGRGVSCLNSQVVRWLFRSRAPKVVLAIWRLFLACHWLPPDTHSFWIFLKLILTVYTETPTMRATLTTMKWQTNNNERALHSFQESLLLLKPGGSWKAAQVCS